MKQYTDTCQIQVLLFSDDTVLVTEMEEDLEHNNHAIQAQAGSELDKSQHHIWELARKPQGVK